MTDSEVLTGRKKSERQQENKKRRWTLQGRQIPPGNAHSPDSTKSGGFPLAPDLDVSQMLDLPTGSIFLYFRHKRFREESLRRFRKTSVASSSK